MLKNDFEFYNNDIKNIIFIIDYIICLMLYVIYY